MGTADRFLSTVSFSTRQLQLAAYKKIVAMGQQRKSVFFYSITSSASCRRCDGTSRPNALAVLRSITSSKPTPSCPGRSAGLAPLRIFPVRSLPLEHIHKGDPITHQAPDLSRHPRGEKIAGIAWRAASAASRSHRSMKNGLAAGRSASSPLNHSRERQLKLAIGTRCQHLQALPESVRRCLYLGFVGPGARVVGVHKQHDCARRGECLGPRALTKVLTPVRLPRG